MFCCEVQRTFKYSYGSLKVSMNTECINGQKWFKNFSLPYWLSIADPLVWVNNLLTLLRSSSWFLYTDPSFGFTLLKLNTHKCKTLLIVSAFLYHLFWKLNTRLNLFKDLSGSKCVFFIVPLKISYLANSVTREVCLHSSTEGGDVHALHRIKPSEN